MSMLGNTQTDDLLKAQVVAAYTSAIISAMGRPVSMRELEEIKFDVECTMFPQPHSGGFKEWQKTFDSEKIYK